MIKVSFEVGTVEELQTQIKRLMHFAGMDIVEFRTQDTKFTRSELDEIEDVINSKVGMNVKEVQKVEEPVADEVEEQVEAKPVSIDTTECETDTNDDPKTEADCKAALQAMLSEKGVTAAKALLSTFKVENIKELKPEQREAFINGSR